MVSIRILTPADDRSKFDSGNEDLNRFFRKYAALNQFVLHIGATYVAVEHERILGFTTVAPATIQADDFPSTRTKKFPQYPLPALRLARLAVLKQAHGKGIGTGLLRYAFSLALEMSAKVGCVGVLVDAKPTAVGFYTGFGFEVREAAAGMSLGHPEPVLMFLSLDKLRAAIE
jgi:GNAT superfamily N-acetyltransferase